MQRHLLIVLALLVFWAPAVAGADDTGEELPWWAVQDYPEEEAADAAPGPAALADVEEAAQATDNTWWAGGDDAVLVLAGGKPVEGAKEEGTAAAIEPDVVEDGGFEEPGEQADGDDGRNPLFAGRPDGHRAGEEPPGGTTGDPVDLEVVVEEKRHKDDDAPCNRLPKQIERYEAQLNDAQDRDDDRAESILEAHLDRLKARKEKLCWEYTGPSNFEKTVVVLAKMVRLAAKVARLMYGSPF
jgi:hypothetical protein